MKVNILNYRAVNKGFVKGFFSLEILPYGITIFDCCHFHKDGNEWFTFPRKETKKEGQPSSFWPYIMISQTDFHAKLKESTLIELKNVQDYPAKKLPDPIPVETSFSFEQSPF